MLSLLLLDTEREPDKMLNVQFCTPLSFILVQLDSFLAFTTLSYLRLSIVERTDYRELLFLSLTLTALIGDYTRNY